MGIENGALAGLPPFYLNGFDPDPGCSFFIKSYLFRGAQAEINDPVARFCIVIAGEGPSIVHPDNNGAPE